MAEQSKLRPDQRLACRRLAIEVYRTYDQQLLNTRSSPAMRQKAFRRLQAALPSLTEFLNDHLLEYEELEYVRDLLQRLIVKGATGGSRDAEAKLRDQNNRGL